MNLLKLISFFMLLSVNDWVRYAPIDQKFSIESPCTMKSSQKELLLDIGKLTIHNCTCSPDPKDPNFLYVVNYVDYPLGTIHKDSITLKNELINESINSTILNLKGVLDYSTETNIDGQVGHLARISYEGGSKVCKSKYILHQDRFYAIQVYSLKETSINRNTERFFDSFGL